MARTRHRVRRRNGIRDRGGVLLVSALVAGLASGLAACGNQEPDEAPAPTDEPYDESAELRPDLLELEQDEVRAGTTIEMYFPEESPRGVGFVLEQEVDGAWQLRYFLTAAEHAGTSPSWWPAGERDDAGWPDVGVTGPGPNWIQIPHTADPGSYRVCTANAEDGFCAPLQVTE